MLYLKKNGRSTTERLPIFLFAAQPRATCPLRNHIPHFSSSFSSMKFSKPSQTQVYTENLMKYKGIKGQGWGKQDSSCQKTIWIADGSVPTEDSVRATLSA